MLKWYDAICDPRLDTELGKIELTIKVIMQQLRKYECELWNR